MVALIVILVNTKLAVGLNRDDGAVGESKLHPPVIAGTEQVAGVDFIAGT